MPAGDPARVGSYHIHTWGCQMNVHDSEKLAGLLEREGYVRAAGENDADVILRRCENKPTAGLEHAE